MSLVMVKREIDNETYEYPCWNSQLSGFGTVDLTDRTCLLYTEDLGQVSLTKDAMQSLFSACGVQSAKSAKVADCKMVMSEKWVEMTRRFAQDTMGCDAFELPIKVGHLNFDAQGIVFVKEHNTMKIYWSPTLKGWGCIESTDPTCWVQTALAEQFEKLPKKALDAFMAYGNIRLRARGSETWTTHSEVVEHVCQNWQRFLERMECRFPPFGGIPEGADPTSSSSNASMLVAIVDFASDNATMIGWNFDEVMAMEDLFPMTIPMSKTSTIQDLKHLILTHTPLNDWECAIHHETYAVELATELGSFDVNDKVHFDMHLVPCLSTMVKVVRAGAENEDEDFLQFPCNANRTVFNDIKQMVSKGSGINMDDFVLRESEFNKVIPSWRRVVEYVEKEGCNVVVKFSPVGLAGGAPKSVQKHHLKKKDEPSIQPAELNKQTFESMFELSQSIGGATNFDVGQAFDQLPHGELITMRSVLARDDKRTTNAVKLLKVREYLPYVMQIKKMKSGLDCLQDKFNKLYDDDIARLGSIDGLRERLAVAIALKEKGAVQISPYPSAPSDTHMG